MPPLEANRPRTPSVSSPLQPRKTGTAPSTKRPPRPGPAGSGGWGDAKRRAPAVRNQARRAGSRGASSKAPPRGGFGAWVIVFVLTLPPVAAAERLSGLWWACPLWLTLASVIAHGLYARDKKRAVTGGWRIPENSLHLSELLGGWPGAFLAQRRLRHKCRKIPYQILFWGIVALYQLLAMDILLDNGPFSVLSGFLSGESSVTER